MEVERCFINPRGMPGRPSQRHLLFSVDNNDEYFPRIMGSVYDAVRFLRIRAWTLSYRLGHARTWPMTARAGKALIKRPKSTFFYTAVTSVEPSMSHIKRSYFTFRIANHTFATFWIPPAIHPCLTGRNRRHASSACHKLWGYGSRSCFHTNRHSHFHSSVRISWMENAFLQWTNLDVADKRIQGVKQWSWTHRNCASSCYRDFSNPKCGWMRRRHAQGEHLIRHLVHIVRSAPVLHKLWL